MRAISKGLSVIGAASVRGRQLLSLLRERETRRRIGIAARRYETSRLAVLVRIIKLYLLARYHPQESLATGLANPKIPLIEHRNQFSDEQLHGLQLAVNTLDAAMCRDKLLFHSYCRYHGLPVPDLYAVLSRWGSRSDGGRPLERTEDLHEFIRGNLPPKFIAKPRGGNRGRGILLLGCGAENPDDAAVRALGDELARLAQGREDYLLQERLRIHPDIRDLTGSDAISTIRGFTLVRHGEAPRLMGAYLRIIASDGITDNISDFSTGGFSGNVLGSTDLETGILEWAIAPNMDGVGRDPIETHPRTGHRISGFQIPMWADVRDLMVRAAACFLPLRTMGWDVAITPDGPFLIEANELFQNSTIGPGVVSLRAGLEAERARLRRPA